jgi:hypothetical protein
MAALVMVVARWAIVFKQQEQLRRESEVSGFESLAGLHRMGELPNIEVAPKLLIVDCEVCRLSCTCVKKIWHVLVLQNC